MSSDISFPLSNQPQNCGDFSIFIDKYGRWFHEGQEIKRKKICKLFASVLSRDTQGQYWLKTPVESGRIEVEEHPLLIEGYYRDPTGVMWVETSIDVCFEIGRQHPLALCYDEREGSHYLTALYERGIIAKFSRASYYHLLEEAEMQENADGTLSLSIQSGDYLFQKCVLL